MSDLGGPRKVPDVRMNVKVSGREFPLLTDELASLPKGPRRTHRLAHLATLGLVWERVVAVGGPTPSVVPAPPDGIPSLSAGTATEYQSRLDATQLAALLSIDADP